MNEKKITRLRRAKRTRIKLKELGMHRLTVHKSNQHIYAQILTPDGDKVVASASTLDKDIRVEKVKKKSVEIAAQIGKLIGQRAGTLGIKDVGFDRSGYKYHGHVQALADGARESGLKF